MPWDGWHISKRKLSMLSLDTAEDIAVLGTCSFGSLSLGIIVLILMTGYSPALIQPAISQEIPPTCVLRRSQ